MNNNSKQEVLNLINSNVNLLLRAKGLLYHNKVFVVYNGTKIDKFYKTKRGSHGYINRNKNFSYYDDYTQDLVYPNSCMEAVEIQESELKDITTDKELWQNYIRKHMNDITMHHLEDNIIHIAKDAEVTTEVMTYIQGKIKEIQTTGGMTIDNFSKVATKEEQKKDVSTNTAQFISTDTQNTSIEADSDTSTVTGIQVHYNQEKGGIELIFPGKPDAEVLSQLKSNGFRWSRYQKLWWAKDTAERRAFIKDIFSADNNINNSTITEDSTQTQQPKKVTYPEINLNDIDSYTVPEELSKRENNNAMFRSEDIDHTKELQKTLQSANNDVIELCKMPSCTEYIQYKAKSYLQSFKGKYTDAYISILEHKVNNPSWVVTGRGNLNTSKYNKKQEQYDRKLQYANRLIDKFNSKIQQYRNQINSINNKKEYNQYLQDIKGIDPSKEKFKKTRVKINRGAVDHIFNNADYEVAAYEYKGYYILKNYSRFNIYDSKGQEIEQKYTDGTLRNAKINLIYYLSNLAVTEQAI